MADDTPDIVLSGEQLERLCKALEAAFPEPMELSQFARFKLDVRLPTIADGNQSNRVFQLVQWAESTGRLRELLNQACEQKPKNPALCAFSRSLRPTPAPAAVADLRDLDTFVRETLAERPNLADLLVGRVGCSRATLQHSLIHELPARDIAAHFNALDQVLSKGSRDDRRACRAMLFRLLPMVADWQALRETVRFDVVSKPRPVTLPFRGETLAEIVLAGGLDRACRFVLEPGRMPVGLGLVRRPAGSQTALFLDDGRRLVEQVVRQLAERFMIEREAPDRHAQLIAAKLKIQRRAPLDERLQYYFLFHDAEHPDGDTADAFWTLTRDVFAHQLSELQVVRMARDTQGDEDEIAVLIHSLLLRDPP